MTYDPKKTEDQWFALHEKDLIRSLRRERERLNQHRAEKLQEEERNRQKEVHWMKCPKCGSDLYQQRISGLTIDFCLVCDGIYFDRKELEDLLLKSKKERRTIGSWIFSYPEDPHQSKAGEILASLNKWRQHKNQQLARLLSTGEAQSRKDLHWMRCPKCAGMLAAQETHGVTAEHCPDCLGMFIDRLEMQKLFLKQAEERRNIVFRMLTR